MFLKRQMKKKTIFSRLVKKIKIVGLSNFLMSLLKRIFFLSLRLRYKFNVWHASSPLESTPYKSQVIDLVNSFSPSTVVEIGCGLGEMLTKIKSQYRIGIDYDFGAIQAATFLNKKNIEFIHHDFESIKNIDLNVSKIDFLLMINWTHEMKWEVLKKNLSQFNSCFRTKYLLIDIIKEGNEGYPFFHTKENLSKLGKIIKVVPARDHVREICLLELN
jgi:SAM-dependent methyltransferase